MSILFQRCFEILVTSIELGLFYYFIAKRLTPGKYFFPGALISFFSLLVFASILNQFDNTIHLTLALGLIVEVSFTFIFTKGTFTEKLFWGCLYRIVDLFAESLTFLILDTTTQYNSSTLVDEYPLHYIVCIVYLLLLTTFTIFLTNLKKDNVALPRWILPVFVFVIILGIIAVETLLNISIYFDRIKNSTYSDTLYFAIWIFLFIFTIVLLLIVYLNRLYQKNIKLMEEKQIQQLEKQQFEMISHTIQVLRVWKHDSKQHFSVITELIGNEKYADAIKYIRNINEDFETHQFGIFTGNSVLDAVISTKLISIRENGIQFSHSIYLPEQLPFDQISLSSLMGNLFDNAITACLQIEDITNRYITLTIKPHQNSLSICIENSSNGKYRYHADHSIKSTKDNANHGIGLRRIRQIAESVNGFCQIQPEKDKFIVTVVVPLGIL